MSDLKIKKIEGKINAARKIQGNVKGLASANGSASGSKIQLGLENLVVNPSLEEQNFKPTRYAYSNVKVNAIEADSLNIKPSASSQEYSGLYKDVNVSAIEEEEKAATLNFSNADTIEVTPTEGKYLKKVNINKDINLVPENIMKDIEIEGILGSYEGMDTSDATAIASNILISKTAYVDGKKVTGTMPNNGSLSYTPSDEVQSIPKGYTTGGSVKATDITLLNDYILCNNLAKTILGKEDEIIPYSKKISYLEATGTQYIDTEITPDNSIVIEIKYFKNSAIRDTEPIFGAGNVFELNRYASQNRFLVIANNSYTAYDLYLNNNTEYVVKVGNKVVSVNDTLLHSDFPLPNSSTNKIELFHTTDYGGRFGAYRLYYCTIWKNGAMVRHFIPVLDNSNVPCLYDALSNKLFYNKGTGTFSAGAII